MRCGVGVAVEHPQPAAHALERVVTYNGCDDSSRQTDQGNHHSDCEEEELLAAISSTSCPFDMEGDDVRLATG
jgi:hypothetical protein